MKTGTVDDPSATSSCSSGIMLERVLVWNEFSNNRAVFICAGQPRFCDAKDVDVVIDDEIGDAFGLIAD